MIAVDTSALIAVVQHEAQGEACMQVLKAESDMAISAVSVAEALVVAGARNLSQEVRDLLDGLGFDVIEASRDTAERVGAIYQRWGRGKHPASLNFADCFAYDVARIRDCPLLFVGNDFRRTDIRSVL